MKTGQPSPRWAFLDGFQVRKNGRPYLDRLRLVQTPWLSLMLHRIHGPDEDRAPHDHPWAFTSLILSGSYTERIWDEPSVPGASREARRRRFSLHAMRHSQAHEITAVSGVLWTLVVTGRRRPGEWGFWVAQEDGTARRALWREYSAAQDEDPF